MKRTILVFLLLIANLLHGQKILPLYYSITNEQAFQIMESKHSFDEKTFLRKPITNITNESRLPNGYYFKSKIKGEEQQITLFVNTSLDISVFNNQQDLMVSVLDSTGKSLPGALLHFGKKRLKYHNDLQAFVIKRRHKDGIIRLVANGEQIFIPVNNFETQFYKRRWHKIKGTRTYRIFTFPLRLTIRTYRFLKYWIQYNNAPFGYLFPNSRHRTNKGYIITNKPIYRHNDSLRVKVFFTKNNGRPWKKDLFLTIAQGLNRKKIAYLKMTNHGGGNYTSNFLLPAHIPLDSYVNLSATTNRTKRKEINMNIKIEDYQLDQMEFDLSCTQNTYKKGEKIILTAGAHNKNGHNIPDGHLRITATANAINWKHDTYLKDTLWTYNKPLGLSPLTQIIIPDSIFPAMDLRVHINAWFSDSKGETKNKSFSFTLKHFEEYKFPEISLQNEHILVKGTDTFSTFKLHAYSIDGTKKELDIKLPFQEKIDKNIFKYTISKNDSLFSQLHMRRQKELITFSGYTKVDSVAFELHNPRKINLHWQLLQGRKKIREGLTAASHFYWSGKNNQDKQYTLLYQYYWAGAPFSEKKNILNYKQKLNIVIEQPKQSSPGKEVPIKINVTDYKGRSRSGVNLSATSTNSSFGNKRHYQSSPITYRLPPNRFIYNNYLPNTWKNNTWNIPIDSLAYHHYQLDKELYYQLRHPKNGLFERVDSITSNSDYDSIVQFTPFIVKDGQVQPIYLIYCNRQLVHYYGSTHKSPNSFIGRPGINHIIIRTYTHQYSIEGVVLHPGQKLLFSIDENNYQQITKYKIVRRAVGNELSGAEKYLIEKSVLILKNPPYGYYYFQDKTQNVLALYSNNKYRTPLIIGPLTPYDSIRIITPYFSRNKFHFEPGYQYELSAKRERLYKNYLFPKKKYILPYIQPNYDTNAMVRVKMPSPRETKSIPYQIPYSQPITPYNTKGTVYLKLQNDTLPRAFLALITPDSSIHFYPRQIKAISQLLPGHYSLIMGYQNNEVITKNFSIIPNQSTYLVFEKKEAKAVKESNPVWKQYQYYIESKSQHYQQYPSIYQNSIGQLDATNGSLLTGTITDQDGNPLIGASVHIRGSKHGTITDFEGNYSLYVPNRDYDIVFFYTGFTSQNFYRKSGGELNIEMEEGIHLPEVVVVSYKASLMKNEMTTQGLTTISSNLESVRSSVKVSANLIEETSIDTRASMDINAFNQRNITPDYRSNFKDNAMWRPNLITDKNGETYFQYRLPDDITSWNTTIIGMDNKNRMGLGYAQIKSIQPITAELAIPRFTIAGDKINIIGKTINFTRDTFSVTTLFEQGGQVIQSHQYQLENYIIDSTMITTPSQQDSLRLAYLIKKSGYSDGEKRSIKIHPIGTTETFGEFHILEKDTSIRIQPSKEAGDLTLYLQGSPLDLMRKHIDYLINYQYMCNEQVASQLLSLLLQKQIHQTLGLPFTHSKKILKAITRLQETQNPNGSWGWWQNGQGLNWITSHVTNILGFAKDQGYDSPPLEKALQFITSNIGSKKGINLLDDLITLNEAGQNLDYEHYIREIDGTILSLYGQLKLMSLKQDLGISISIDSLLQKGTYSLHGTLHFQEKQHRSKHEILPNIVAFKLLVKAGKTEEAKQVQRYLLKQKHWRNTYLSSKTLQILVPEILANYHQDQKFSVRFRQGNQDTLIQSFPYENRLLSTDTLYLHKQGSGLIYATTHQTKFNPDPQPKQDIFKISTYFTQGGEPVDYLKKGSKAKLTVQIEVTKQTEYVLIEVPIPAGTSYYSKSNNRYYPEVHREYFREKTAIFCEQLEPGSYAFHIDLEPRFTGNYTLNPVRVEEMYFPVFYGRNGVKQIKIIE